MSSLLPPCAREHTASGSYSRVNLKKGLLPPLFTSLPLNDTQQCPLVARDSGRNRKHFAINESCILIRTLERGDLRHRSLSCLRVTVALPGATYPGTLGAGRQEACGPDALVCSTCCDVGVGSCNSIRSDSKGSGLGPPQRLCWVCRVDVRVVLDRFHSVSASPPFHLTIHPPSPFNDVTEAVGNTLVGSRVAHGLGLHFWSVDWSGGCWTTR